MFKLFINDQLAIVDKIEKSYPNHYDVFINNYSSCHSLPMHLIDNKINKTVITNGNKYTFIFEV